MRKHKFHRITWLKSFENIRVSFPELFTQCTNWERITQTKENVLLRVKVHKPNEGSVKYVVIVHTDIFLFEPLLVTAD